MLQCTACYIIKPELKMFACVGYICMRGECAPYSTVDENRIHYSHFNTDCTPSAQARKMMLQTNGMEM